LVSQDILDDIELARKIIKTTDDTIVITQYGKIWNQKKGEEVKIILETLDEMGEKIKGSTIGLGFLNKASALLCRYANANAVYSPKATKTAIALLIMGGIPSQIDKMIPNVELTGDTKSIEYNNLLKDITSPEEAYKILKEKKEIK